MTENQNNIIAILGGNLDTVAVTALGHEVIECNGPKDFWGAGLSRFEGRNVIVVYATRNQRIQAIIAVRQIMSVADTVRLLPFSDARAKDLSGFLASAKPVPATLLDIGDQEYQAMVENSANPVVHPAQDYFSGEFYYGVKLNGAPYLITSKGQLISFLEAGKLGITLLQDQLFDARITHDAVVQFLTTEDAQSVFPFQPIVEYLQKFIYLPEPELYDVLALWILGTYIYRAFRYTPYLHLHAEKRSGKTLLMELIAPISFNGTIVTNPNASSVLRAIDRDSAAMFIDETEALSSEQAGGKIELMSVLKTGFSRSGQVTRASDTFSTFGPKCFASINDLDDVLADRAITIRMMRKTLKEKVQLYRENPEMVKFHSELRDNLYLFGLRYGPGIAAAYECVDGPYDTLPHLTNRAFDIWLPLFKIAEAIPDAGTRNRAFDSLDKCSQLDVRRKMKRDSEDNDSTSLLLALESMMKELKPLRVESGVEYYDPDSVHFFLLKGGYLSRGMQKKALSRFLKRTLEIESVPKAFGELTKRMYAIDLDLLHEYRRRYLGATADPAV